MKHYYTNNEDLISEPEQFIFTYRGKELIFTSDHGVFSKKMIDFGSRVLLDAIELLDTLVSGKRLKDISDLPLDLAV